MNFRLNWKESGLMGVNNFNFRWSHISNGINFNNLSKNFSIRQVVNHYEFHSFMSNKQNLFLSLMRYCEV